MADEQEDKFTVYKDVLDRTSTGYIFAKVPLEGKLQIVAMEGNKRDGKITFDNFIVLNDGMNVYKAFLKGEGFEGFEGKTVTLPKPMESRMIDGEVAFKSGDIRKTIQTEYAKHRAIEEKAEREISNGDFTMEMLKCSDGTLVALCAKSANHIQRWFNGSLSEDGHFTIFEVDDKTLPQATTFKNVATNEELDPEKLRNATATDGKTTFKQFVAAHHPKKETAIEETPEVDANPEGGHIPPKGIPPKANSSNTPGKQGGRED